MKCPVSGVNIPRFALSVLAAFVVIFVFDFLWHGVLMMDLYNQTPQLWRGEDEMGAYFPFMLIMQIIMAKVLVLLYTRNHEGKGIMEGVRYGFLVGLVMAVGAAQSYAYMPVPMMVPVLWAVGYIIQFILVGVVASLIYKPCDKGGCGCCCDKEAQAEKD